MNAKKPSKFSSLQANNTNIMVVYLRFTALQMLNFMCHHISQSQNSSNRKQWEKHSRKEKNSSNDGSYRMQVLLPVLIAASGKPYTSFVASLQTRPTFIPIAPLDFNAMCQGRQEETAAVNSSLKFYLESAESRYKILHENVAERSSVNFTDRNLCRHKMSTYTLVLENAFQS